MKLYINEDTACIAAKTSYNDSGLDANGIYYFGKKPESPQNWKDFIKGKRKSNMVKRDKLSEGYDEMREEYLAEDNTLKEYGQILPLDEIVYGMTDNLPDDEIDEAMRYFERVSGSLGSRGKFSNIYCYLCTADWLNPMDFNFIRQSSKPLYKGGKYSSFVCSLNGIKFITDRFSTNYDFTIYARSEEDIIQIMKDIEEAY